VSQKENTMGLMDFFQFSPQMKLRKKMEKHFDYAVREANKASSNNPFLSGVLCFSSISHMYDSLKRDDDLFQQSGVSRTEYLQILEDVLNQKGREYISNWDQMRETNEMERIQREEDQQMHDFLFDL